MIKASWLIVLAALGILPLSAQAQNTAAQTPPAPFLHYSFDDGLAKWDTQGTPAKASITHDPAHVKVGQGALQYDYKVAKKEMSALYLPIPDRALAKAKAIRFWVMTDYAAPLFVTLQERDGGRYVALIAAPKFKWQQVDLAPSDFTLSEDANDPRDENNRLDMDEVVGISIVDVAQFLVQSDEGFSKLFAFQSGPRTLYLDDFRVSEETLPPAISAVNMDVKLDTLVRPQLSWLGVGEPKLALTSGKPLEGRSLQIDYHQAPGQLTAIMRRIPRGKLAGTTRITFTAAATHATKLLVQVEEKGGGKYNKIVEISGDKAARDVFADFTEMKGSDDSKDANGHLDIDQIVQIVFIDVTGQIDMTEADNTLWINNLRAGVVK